MQAKDPLRFFRLEAREIAEDMGRTVLALEKQAASGQIARLLRLAHTLKGAAAVVKQREIAAQAHALEDVLVPFRDREDAVTGDDIERILAHTDAIARNVAALGAETERAANEPAALPGIGGAEVDALLLTLAQAGVLMRGARQSGALVEEARHLSAQLADAIVDHRGDEVPATEARAGLLCEELQGTLGRLDAKLKRSLDMAEREMTQAHAAAERLRLLPCSAVLSPVERAVRDTAAALGKDAIFIARGGEARLDAGILGLMQRALLQLARNAVAHGLETAQERASAGKPPQGRVEIDISRRGNRVAFTCRDDGRGIDIAAVRRAAQGTGKPEAEIGEDELVRLLFKGGVSTAGTVTELSGRGVGLDIVRDVAGRLGGEVSARTHPGQGTEIELLVPASLSAMDALLIETDGTVCAIPLEAVRGSLRLQGGDVMHRPDGDWLALDGEAVAFVPLARLLKCAVIPSGAAKLAVLVGTGQARAAIGAERLLGVANIVVRPLPELSFADPVIAGGSVDPEGNPRLVLEPRALIAAALKLTASRKPGETSAAGPPPPILIIDDSLTTRVLEQSILESAGYEVELATSAEEALVKARQRRYGLFLVDVEMPGMNGFGFITTIRADPELRAIPAILVTSLNAPEDRQRGQACGAQAYVVKSEFDQVKVLETIRQCLAPA